MKPILTRLFSWLARAFSPRCEHYIDLPLGRSKRLRYRPAFKDTYISTRLPGGPLMKTGRKRGRLSIDVQCYDRPGLSVMLRTIRVNRATTIACREEVRWLRLEAVLTGELLSRDGRGNEVRVPSGHYHFTDQPQYQNHYPAKTGCSYMILFFPPEALDAEVIPAFIGPTHPRELNLQMKDILNKMLDTRLKGEMLTWYYHAALGQVLYAHCGLNPRFINWELAPGIRDKMEEVRRIMQADPRGRITPAELEQRIGLSLPRIQRSYQISMGRTLFEDRITQRMAEACHLLETTTRSIKRISSRAGYLTLPGFVIDFRTHIGQPPGRYQRQYRAKAGARSTLIPGCL